MGSHLRLIPELFHTSSSDIGINLAATRISMATKHKLQVCGGCTVVCWYYLLVIVGFLQSSTSEGTQTTILKEETHNNVC